ncbi:MAG: DeoR family transcriptional regulator, partial [Bacteroidota bacterium]
ISEIDWEETQVKRAMIDASQELAALVIQEKLGTTQPYLLAPPDRLTTLVTSLDKRHPALSPYRSQGIELL